MKVFLGLVGLFALVSAKSPAEITTPYNYHGKIGIPLAQRIKQAESALDFDGSKIAGGRPSSLSKHPYMGGLHIHLMHGLESVCGSTLISNTKLLTAAHCWFDGTYLARYFTVVLGSEYLFRGGVRIDTRDVLKHPRYTDQYIFFDIAVVTIKHVDFTDNIKPIALDNGFSDHDGVVATAVGYGLTSDDETGVSRETSRSEVDLRVISNMECRRTYGWSILDSSLCVSGEGGRSTCSGDAGGPLVMGSGDSKSLIGIASFTHVDGCEKGYPAAFARITSFVDWIQEQMQTNSEKL